MTNVFTSLINSASVECGQPLKVDVKLINFGWHDSRPEWSTDFKIVLAALSQPEKVFKALSDSCNFLPWNLKLQPIQLLSVPLSNLHLYPKSKDPKTAFDARARSTDLFHSPQQRSKTISADRSSGRFLFYCLHFLPKIQVHAGAICQSSPKQCVVKVPKRSATVQQKQLSQSDKPTRSVYLGLYWRCCLSSYQNDRRQQDRVSTSFWGNLAAENGASDEAVHNFEDWIIFRACLLT